MNHQPAPVHHHPHLNHPIGNLNIRFPMASLHTGDTAVIESGPTFYALPTSSSKVAASVSKKTAPESPVTSATPPPISIQQQQSQPGYKTLVCKNFLFANTVFLFRHFLLTLNCCWLRNRHQRHMKTAIWVQCFEAKRKWSDSCAAVVDRFSGIKEFWKEAGSGLRPSQLSIRLIIKSDFEKNI